MTAVEFVLDGLLLVVVSIAAVSDVRKHTIPDWLTLPAMLLGLGARFFFYGMGGAFGLGLSSALFGLGVCFLIFGLFMVWGRGMGGGDVKLMMAVGAMVGFRQSLTWMMCAGIVGAVLALILVVFKRRVLATAKGIWLQFYQLGDEVSVAKVTLPYGVAIAIGGMWATAIKYGFLGL